MKQAVLLGTIFFGMIFGAGYMCWEQEQRKRCTTIVSVYKESCYGGGWGSDAGCMVELLNGLNVAATTREINRNKYCWYEK